MQLAESLKYAKKRERCNDPECLISRTVSPLTITLPESAPNPDKSHFYLIIIKVITHS